MIYVPAEVMHVSYLHDTLLLFHVMALLQLRFEYDSSAVRARFGYEAYEMPTIRARYSILRGAYEELCAFEQ